MFCLDCEGQINPFDLFKCKDCSMMTHIECNMYSIAQIQQYNITSCDLCRCKATSSTFCCICHSNSGLLKRIDYNHRLNWAHRHCLFNEKDNYFKDGLYVFVQCSDTSCQKCLKPSINEKEDECGEYDIVSTKVKCEVCLQVINEIESKLNDSHSHFNNDYSRCSSCLSWYHDRCEKEFCKANYINSKKSCMKCFKDPHFVKCFLCFNQGGLMVPCDSSYAHSLCIYSFINSFKRRRGNKLAFDSIREQMSKKSQCCICSKTSQYTIECSACRITFHPYCAFKADFAILKSSISGFEYKCSSSHLRYKKNLAVIDNKDNDSNLSSETTACSTIHISSLISMSNVIVKKDITDVNNTFALPEKKVYKKKCKLKINERNSLISDNNAIDSRQMAKFSWKQMKRFYKDFNREEIEKIFPYSFYTNDQIYDLIKETSTNSMKPNEDMDDYVLCNIKRSKASYYILYKRLQCQAQNQMKEESTSGLDHSNQKQDQDQDPQFIPSCDNAIAPKFLSRKTKRPGYILHSSQEQLSQIKATFLRAFRLSGLSNRILSYERQLDNAKVNEDLAYIDKQIILKKEMLKEVMVSNIQMAKQISSSDSLEITSTDPMKEIRIELTECRSIINFKTIMKRLREGIKDKAYSSLFYGDLPFKGAEQMTEEETADYYENESECCVCLAYCSYSSTHVIYCDNCNVSAHLNCYGIPTVPQFKFKCDLCSKNDHSRIKDIKCSFCLNGQGVMKKMGKSDWAHITCVLISKYAHFDDYYLLEKPIWGKDYDRFILSEDSFTQCSICNIQGGETFKCINCSSSYHFFCAYFKGYKMSFENRTLLLPQKNVSLTITQCPNDAQWSMNHRQLQAKLRRLVYQKD